MLDLDEPRWRGKITAHRNEEKPVTKMGPPNHERGWIEVPRDGIPVTRTEADAAAEALSRGHTLGRGTAARQIREGAHAWSRGDTPGNTKKPGSLAAFHLAVAAARPGAPELHRGVMAHAATAPPEMLWLIHTLATASLGDTVQLTQPASWSSDEAVARRHAGVLHRGKRGPVAPGYTGVMLRLQPGAHALPLENEALSEHRDDQEHVTPPVTCQVTANEPHPDVNGLRLVTLKEL